MTEPSARAREVAGEIVGAHLECAAYDPYAWSEPLAENIARALDAFVGQDQRTMAERQRDFRAGAADMRERAANRGDPAHLAAAIRALTLEETNDV